MTNLINKEIKLSTQILRALDHPLRQQILTHVGNANNSINVTDLQIKLKNNPKVTQPIVSQHLSILRHAKVVTRKTRGKQRYYSVDYQEIERLKSLIKQISNN